MEIVNYLRVLRRRWQLVFAMGVLGLVIGVSTVLLVNPEKSTILYKATHTLVAADNGANLEQLRAFTLQGEVPKRVAEKIGGQPVVLASQIAVDAKTSLQILEITAVSSDPQRAVQLADTFAQELVNYQTELAGKQRESDVNKLKQQQAAAQTQYEEALDNLKKDPDNKDFYTRQKDRAIALYNELQVKIDSVNNTAPKGALTTAGTAEPVPISGKSVASILAANTSTTGKGQKNASNAATIDDISKELGEGPSISPTTRALLGLAMGLFLGAAMALIIERLDPRIRTKDDAEDVFGFPVISETPPLSRRQQKETVVLSWEQPRSRAAEAYRVLRSAILFAAEADGAPLITTSTDDDRPAKPSPQKRRKARVLMVSSASPSEGKTTTTANLAAVLGEAGLRVLVINCDFRRPKVHAFLGADSKPLEIVQTDIDGVSLLNRVSSTASLANPAEVVAIQRKVVRDHLYEFDVIILDTAPLLTTNDAAEVLPVADQVLVVARAGKTTKEAADRTAELLDRRQAPVTGVILIGATDGPGGRYYYYGAGKSYYLDDQLRRPQPERSDRPERTTRADPVDAKPTRDSRPATRTDADGGKEPAHATGGTADPTPPDKRSNGGSGRSGQDASADVDLDARADALASPLTALQKRRSRPT